MTGRDGSGTDRTAAATDGTAAATDRMMTPADGRAMATVDVDRSDPAYRAWLKEAVRKVQADAN
ncbi:PLP-dependent cysteine synthase family protein, partial [Streptomyces sp. NPDC056730]